MVLRQESSSEVGNQGPYDFRLAELIRQRAWVEIDQDALNHNVRQFKSLLKADTDLMAVVKADAYGHGAIRVAQIALDAGANWLAIATLGEGVELREAGILRRSLCSCTGPLKPSIRGDAEIPMCP